MCAKTENSRVKLLPRVLEQTTERDNKNAMWKDLTLCTWSWCCCKTVNLKGLNPAVTDTKSLTAFSFLFLLDFWQQS